MARRRGRQGVDWTFKPDLPHALRVYLAGLFDGEGSVTIRRAKGKKESWSAQVAVSNTDGKALGDLYREAGCPGSIQTWRPTGRKPAYTWVMTASAATWFLWQIRPWLHVRERQADIGIKFTRLLVDRGSVRLSDEEIALRHQLKDELRAINYAGRPGTIGTPAEGVSAGKLAPLPRTLRIYLAGFFDGEGTICIAGGTNRHGHLRWSLRTVVGVTDDSAMRWIFDRVGRIGQLDVRSMASQNGNPITYWGLATSNAARLLRQLRPWMRIRERQADIALEYVRLVRMAKRTAYNRPSAKNVEQRWELKRKLEAVNRSSREYLDRPASAEALSVVAA